MTETKLQQSARRYKRLYFLAEEDFELYELARKCGITIDPQVFHILLELLRLDVSPIALFDVLQDLSANASKSSKRSSESKSSSSHSSGKKKPPVAAKPKKIKNPIPENKQNLMTN